MVCKLKEVFMSKYQFSAKAKYTLINNDYSIEDLWNELTKPFLIRNYSWHPSYGDYKPTTVHPGIGQEFETIGSAGGRYPWRIDHWSNQDKVLKLWRGPSINPPKGYKEIFSGLTWVFKVKRENGSVSIDIYYEERWSKKPWLTKAKCFKNGPLREIQWIFDRFSLLGTIDYILKCENLLDPVE